SSDLAGKIFAVGSFSKPHPTILLFRAATFVAVVEFLQIPKYELEAFGQLTLRLFTFKLLGPTIKRTISFSPSIVPQASTRILSISKQVLGVCAWIFKRGVKMNKTITKNLVLVSINMGLIRKKLRWFREIPSR